MKSLLKIENLSVKFNTFDGEVKALKNINMELNQGDSIGIVGETGSGDYYCIDAGREVEGVMQYDHQSVQFEVFADSIDEFIEMLEDTFCDAESF